MLQVKEMQCYYIYFEFLIVSKNESQQIKSAATRFYFSISNYGLTADQNNLFTEGELVNQNLKQKKGYHR